MLLETLQNQCDGQGQYWHYRLKKTGIIAFIASTLKTRKSNVTLEWLHFAMVLFARARQCFAGVKIREKLFTRHKFTNLLKSVWRLWFTPRGKF